MAMKTEPDLTPGEHEDSIRIFSILCHYDDVILVVSTLGWHCKKCDVNFDFKSCESIEHHLHSSHDIDTGPAGGGKQVPETSGIAATSENAAAAAAYSISPQTKGSEKSTVGKPEDAGVSASSNVGSLSVFGKSKKRTFKAVEAESAHTKQFKRSKKSEISVSNISPSTPTTSHILKSEEDVELIKASAAMQPSVVLTKVDNVAPSKPKKTNALKKVLQKGKSSCVKTKVKMAFKTKLKLKSATKATKTLSDNHNGSRFFVDVSALRDKYVSKLSSDAIAVTDTNCRDGVQRQQSNTEQGGNVHHNHGHSNKTGERHSQTHRTDQCPDSTPSNPTPDEGAARLQDGAAVPEKAGVELSVAEDETTICRNRIKSSVLQDGTAVAGNATVQPLAENEAGSQSGEIVAEESAEDAGNISARHEINSFMPHLDQSCAGESISSVSEKQSSGALCSLLEGSVVTQSYLQALDLSVSAVSSDQQSKELTSVSELDPHKQVTAHRGTVGLGDASFVTVTLPANLGSFDQGEMALLTEDQPVENGVTLMKDALVLSADHEYGRNLACGVTEPGLVSDDLSVEVDPTEAAVRSIESPQSLYFLQPPNLPWSIQSSQYLSFTSTQSLQSVTEVVSARDQACENRQTELSSEAQTSSDSAQPDTSSILPVCSASEEKDEKDEIISNSHTDSRSSKNRAKFRLASCLGSTPVSRRIFECDFCHHPFVDPCSLQAHVKHYQNQQPMQCRTCQKKFHNLDLLNLHIFSDHDKDSHPSCLTCEKGYLNIRTLTEHIAKFHPASKDLSPIQLRLDSLNTEKCRVCGVSIRQDPKLLKFHYESHNRSNFSCRVCGKWFLRRFLVYAHFQLEHSQDKEGKEVLSEIDEETLNKIRTLLEEENSCYVFSRAQELGSSQLFYCKVCEKDVLGTRRGILRHLMKHYGPTNCKQVVYKMYKCPDCGKEIPNTGQNVNYHRLTHGHIDKDNIKLKCSVCTAFFQNEGTVRRHERSVHKFDNHKLSRTYICEICGCKFAGSGALAKHVELHSEEKGLFSCDVCSKSFYFKSQMETHKAKHKSKSELMPCPHCDKVYMSRETLKRHIETIHLGVKDRKYKCDRCPAQYYESVLLRDHIATKHEGKRPYSCRLCAQTFVCRPTLGRHMRRDHEGHNPLVCKTCGEKFLYKDHLVQHESLVHKGVDLFACNICQKSFRLKTTLKKHMDMHRGIRPFLCEECGMGFAHKGDLERHRKKSCKVGKHGSNRYKVQLVESLNVDADHSNASGNVEQQEDTPVNSGVIVQQTDHMLESS